MKKNAIQEKRRYIRISSVLPVEFSLTDDHCRILPPYLQGFTNNISKGGICLVVNDLSGDAAGRLHVGTPLVLQIDLPFKRQAVSLTGRITWKETDELPRFRRLRLGIEFIQTGKYETRLIFNYAVVKKSLPSVIALVVASIAVFSFHVWLNEQQLIVSNKRMVERYKNVMDEITALSEHLGKEGARVGTEEKRSEVLSARIRDLEKECSVYHGVAQARSASEPGAALPAKEVQLQKEIAALKKERDFVDSVIAERKKARKVLLKTMQMKEQEKNLMDTRVAEGMYAWIKSRQNLHTGLILSYEGDHQLQNISYTYDQALAVIVLLLSSENRERAQHVLDFYLQQINEHKPLYNAYYTDDGSANEYIEHSGVYAWIGIAALQYFNASGDARYLELARHVADFLVRMMDPEGGIVGGPGLTWYSTEHNLDALAFFRMLYGATRQQTYLQISERIRSWIDTYAYTRRAIPINRGKGDATIATDTYAWSITALGPEELLKLSMDPDKIIDFAVENCEVETTFFRKQGSVTIKGFDFSKFANTSRGGVVSCEWTAQMILSLQIMAAYCQEKDQEKYKAYLQKVILYASELQKMIINTPSHIGKAYPALPYASDANVDTGHGWRTPYGNEIGSLASTAYFLLAYEGWNPLRGEALPFSLKTIFQQKVQEIYRMLEPQGQGPDT